MSPRNALQRAAESDEAPDGGAGEAERESQLSSLEVAEAGPGSTDSTWMRSGCCGGHFLDFNTALARGHDADPRQRPVEGHSQVELAGDVQPLLDVHFADLLPNRTRLVRAELHSEDFRGQFRASSGDRASFTPPPFPRPPA